MPGDQEKDAPGRTSEKLNLELQRPNGLCGQTFRSFLHLELHLLAFTKRAKSFHLNFGLMHEDIFAAVFGRNKSETFAIIEPLHMTDHTEPA